MTSLSFIEIYTHLQSEHGLLSTTLQAKSVDILRDIHDFEHDRFNIAHTHEEDEDLPLELIDETG